MKTAIYTEDGLLQLVLTPQDDFEQRTLKSFTNNDFKVEIKEGSFYKCQGGWVRQMSSTYGRDDRANSLLLIA